MNELSPAALAAMKNPDEQFSKKPYEYMKRVVDIMDDIMRERGVGQRKAAAIASQMYPDFQFSKERYKNYLRHVYPERAKTDSVERPVIPMANDEPVRVDETIKPEAPTTIDVCVKAPEHEKRPDTRRNRKAYERHYRIQVPVPVDIKDMFEAKQKETLTPISLQCTKILRDYKTLVDSGRIKESLLELL